MNIAEILRHCPKGTKLYSLIHGEVFLENTESSKLSELDYPIQVFTSSGGSEYFTNDGLFNICYPNSECVLFPSKEQRDWSKFRLPVKRGDIMMDINGECPFIATGELSNTNSPKYICGINSLGEFQLNLFKGGWTPNFYIPASEKAKEELFDKMKKAGYKWNADTLELEKAVPEFESKFKSFDKVLVKDMPNHNWSIDLFSHYDEKNKDYPYVCLTSRYRYCIPYEGNEYLVGKTINIKKI